MNYYNRNSMPNQGRSGMMSGVPGPVGSMETGSMENAGPRGQWDLQDLRDLWGQWDPEVSRGPQAVPESKANPDPRALRDPRGLRALQGLRAPVESRA